MPDLKSTVLISVHNSARYLRETVKRILNRIPNKVERTSKSVQDSPLIVYVAQGLGIMGVGRAGFDILVSLVTSKMPVVAVTPGSTRTMRLQVKRIAEAQPRWIPPPRQSAFPLLAKRYSPILLAQWTLDRIANPIRRRRLRQLRPDVIVVNAWGRNDLLAATGLTARKAAAIVIHGSPSAFEYLKYLRERQDSRDINWALSLMDRYSHLIFVSSRCRDEWLALGSLATKKSFYIPNCCDEEAVLRLLSRNRAEVRQYLRVPPDRFVGVCVASIQHRKGQDLLLDCFPDILASIPNLLIYLVGPTADHALEERLRQWVERSAFGNRLIIVGPRSDALDFIYAADVLVLPSRSEAMPLTILEAMALKTPAIASDVGGIPELIENEATGLLFPSDQPARLAEALVRIARDTPERRAFAERASQRYWSNFSRTLHAQRYAQAIEEMLE